MAAHFLACEANPGDRPQARDPTYGATPLGWASHNQQAEVVAYLSRFTPGDS